MDSSQRGICGCRRCGCSEGLFQAHITLSASVFSGEVTRELLSDLSEIDTELILIYNYHRDNTISSEYVTSTLGNSYNHCLDIISVVTKIIESYGIHADRVKIEAAPHGKYSERVLYYESHYKVKEVIENYPYSETYIKDRPEKNKFVTLRSTDIKDTLIDIDCIKRTTECVLLDTNPDLDRSWYDSYFEKKDAENCQVN